MKKPYYVEAKLFQKIGIKTDRAEVKRMCITEYDEARTFAEQREEGREEGVLATLIGLVKKGILTLAQTAEEAHMTVAEFEAKTGLKA